MTVTITETTPPTTLLATPMTAASAGSKTDQPDPAPLDAQATRVGPVTNSKAGGGETTKVVASTSGPTSLADPGLGLAAEILDDLERTRIANENRLRQMTGTAVDDDGLRRQRGYDPAHADIVRLTALVDLLRDGEHKASLHLRNVVRRHPLWSGWAKCVPGLGEQQFARLLAAVGDPYLRESVNDDGDIDLTPRTVSALWAYTGYRVDDGQAQRHRKGQQSNWSSTAKMRAYLIAEVCVRLDGKPDKNGRERSRSPYRDVYDERKARTDGHAHQHACVRCGPSGKPAQPGSAWSDAHRHADAIRVAAKTLLRDMWREAKRLHESA